MPNQICTKIVLDANIDLRHINQMEAEREIKRTLQRQKRLYKQAKEMQRRQELEDAKSHAVDLAVNK